ncbi:MAG: hypothetical protein IKD10_10620 [Lentisphaeria bacterium]|nr:hypothetical protein [Lentisphaeria bacterium]
MNIENLEQRLNDFDPAIRKAALLEAKTAFENKEIEAAEVSDIHNMHCHSFFSYNGYGYSPSFIVYLAKKMGFYAVGLVDFDVLDGVDEFSEALELLNVRGCCGMETRVFIPELADKEINSPGEPGIAYHLGCGFKSGKVPAEQKAFAEMLRKNANFRTRKVVELVNGYLAPVVIDFDEVAKKYTPFGNVTERHVCSAYRDAASAVFTDKAELAAFWSEKLGIELAEAEKLLANPVKLEGVIRSKTMKSGGVGYVKPSPESFPTLSDMNKFITGCNAVPTLAWLNGMSAGENALDELIKLHKQYVRRRQR